MDAAVAAIRAVAAVSAAATAVHIAAEEVFGVEGNSTLTASAVDAAVSADLAVAAVGAVLPLRKQ